VRKFKTPLRSRSFRFRLTSCGSLNVTVAPPSGPTYLTIWPAGQPQPPVSTLNALNGAIPANAAIVPAGGSPSAPGAVSVFAATQPT